ncbi:MAG TPA: hypothetical protein VFG28_02335 [Syntrophales bacterium]|nr:hypothetical protein [Syntrophales bacterium]
MKKLLIGFLAVGLIMGFAMTASAQPNIKASGQLYIQGTYANQPSLLNNGLSKANVANRLRMQFEIQVQEGLKLTTRFDALERAWGQVPAVLTDSATSTNYVRPENNISFERAYVTFNALYGVFDVGYKQSRVWGTCAFCDDYDSDPGVLYTYMMGPWTFAANWDKRANTDSFTRWFTGLQSDVQGEGSGTQAAGTTLAGTNNDHDVYQIWAIYRWATGQAGLRFEMDYDAAGGKILSNQSQLNPFNGAGTSGQMGEYTTQFYELAPYVQWKYGPFDLEGELRYVWGTINRNVLNGNVAAGVAAPTGGNVDRGGWSLYLNPKYTAGGIYGGLEFAYISGDDPNTTDKYEAGTPGGQAWDPLLMFGNYWYTKYFGAMGSIAMANGQTTSIGPYEQNLIMLKPYIGWKVNPQLEFVAQYGWLKANQKPTNFVGDSYGSELDIYGTYKIYNNLSYTVGFGYFWTGDYFKGTTGATSISDTWMVTNALNFTF